MPSSPFCRWGNETQGDTVAGQVSSQSKGVAEMNFQRSWLQISWLQSPSAVILEPKKIKSAIVSPSICHEVGSKITADVDCNYEIKRRLLLGKKVMTNLDSIFGEGNGTPLRYFAWKIPWMEEPGRLQSVGSLRVRHDWATSLSLFTFLNWRRKWQPTAVFLSGESQGWGSLVAAVYGVAQSRTRLKWLSSSSRQHIKSRDITLPTKVLLVKAMVFPVVMYGFESWTIKKAECWRIDAFELWCWRSLLRVPWTARRSKQSILKEISPGCSLEGLMLKLKLQYFGHLMQRPDSFEKDPDAGKDWRQKKGTTEDEMVGWHH